MSTASQLPRLQRLTVEFGKGFTDTNLRYMRLFYLLFETVNAESSLFPLKGIHHAVRDESRNLQKSHALRDELPVIRPDLSWTHYRLLLKVEKGKARNFYLNEAAEAGWSTRQLERQINSFYYERLLSSKDKKPLVDEADRNASPARPEDLIKDPYVLEFLNLKENRLLLEQRRDNELITNCDKFKDKTCT